MIDSSPLLASSLHPSVTLGSLYNCKRGISVHSQHTLEGAAVVQAVVPEAEGVAAAE